MVKLPPFFPPLKTRCNGCGLESKSLIFTQPLLLWLTPGDFEAVQRLHLKKHKSRCRSQVTLTLCTWQKALRTSNVNFNLDFFIYLEFYSDQGKHAASEVRRPGFKAWLHLLQDV